MRYTLLAVLCLGAVAVADPLVIAWRELAVVRSNVPPAAPVVQPLAAAGGGELPASVDRIAVTPEVMQVAVGTRVCISQFDIAAYAATGHRTAGVPITLGMQRGQLEGAELVPLAKDLCFRPKRVGEYTLRFSSKVPAADGTLRGAQVFVRAH